MMCQREPARRINEIVHGERAISADTALRLSRYFGMSENFWMNLQARYDLEVQKDQLGGRLEREVPRKYRDTPAPQGDTVYTDNTKSRGCNHYFKVF